MEKIPEMNNRKRFLMWGLGVIGAVAGAKLLKRRPKKSHKTVTMLTQDGRLVEIRQDLIACRNQPKKITNEELQNWIKK
jgi:hypothetical protein